MNIVLLVYAYQATVMEETKQQTHTVMTHVILIDSNENERYIKFPTIEGFQDYLDHIRALVPDRSFQIFDSWETT